METDKITIVVPTYNKESRLHFLLESLMFQIIKAKIMIIDDGSTDGTRELIMNYNKKLNINYLYQDNRGRSQARNRGIEMCDTQYILFCDDDMILPNSFVQKHLQLLEKNNNIAVHGQIWNLPFLSFFSNPLDGSLYEYVNESERRNSRILSKYLLSLRDIKEQEKIYKQRKVLGLEKKLILIEREGIDELKFLYCTGGNLSCSTSIVKQVGGFDAIFDKGWGCEDIELGYRLMKEGVVFIYSEDAYNYHISHYRQDYDEQLLEAFKLFYLKHNDVLIKNLPELLLSKNNIFSEFIEKNCLL